MTGISDGALLYAIRDRLDNNAAVRSGLTASDRHWLASALEEDVLLVVEQEGQASRRLVFDANGNPQCSWCGRMGCRDGKTPPMPSTHPQYGLFCTCTAPLRDESQPAKTA
jgi:hypothetical protein